MTKQLAIVAATIALIVTLVPVAAYAVDDGPETTEENRATTVRERSEGEREAAKERTEADREAAKERAEEAKSKAQERKLTFAADRCEARKEKLTAIVPKLGNGITSVKVSLDKTTTALSQLTNAAS